VIHYNLDCEALEIHSSSPPPVHSEVLTLQLKETSNCEHLLRKPGKYRVAGVKRLLIILIALAGGYFAAENSSSIGQRPAAPPYSAAALEQAISSRDSGAQVGGSGTVARILSDDRDGSRHQRIILRLDSGRTLLIAHNIDLAPRISNLNVGEEVSFFGVYEWNERGGVIHWTHHDPAGQHVAGWLEHDGIRYQ
jgi:hypothetical protein